MVAADGELLLFCTVRTQGAWRALVAEVLVVDNPRRLRSRGCSGSSLPVPSERAPKSSVATSSWTGICSGSSTSLGSSTFSGLETSSGLATFSGSGTRRPHRLAEVVFGDKDVGFNVAGGHLGLLAALAAQDGCLGRGLGLGGGGSCGTGSGANKPPSPPACRALGNQTCDVLGSDRASQLSFSSAVVLASRVSMIL